MYKTVDIDITKYEEIYEGPSRGRFEYWLRKMPKEYGRKDKVKFEYKRCIFEPDMHFGEMTAFKVAEKIGIPCCEVELFSRPYPANPKLSETGCISYFEQGSDDYLYPAENFASKFARNEGIQNDYMLDIDSIFSAAYEFFQKNNRPIYEYLKFKKDFIVMTVFDLRFGNFDRGLNNWFIRQNRKTGSMELYPMFDNEAILGFTDDVLEDMSYASILKFNNDRMSKVTIPEDRKQRRYTDFREMYKYLLKNYPLETRFANRMFENFTESDLIEILDNMPDISDERKRFARRNYAYRSMTLDRIREDYDANKLTRRRIYSKVDIDERMSS